VSNRAIRLSVLGAFLAVAIIAVIVYLSGGGAKLPISAVTGTNPEIAEPNKRLVPVISLPKAVGWSGKATPAAAPGLSVKAFAGNLAHPRWIYVLPNGDVLVAETAGPKFEPHGIRAKLTQMALARMGAGVPSANRITLLRDTDGDGVAETRSVLLKGLNSPFGMALVGDSLYVANTDALLRFPFKVGQTQITAPGEKVVDLPAGINHWTRNVVANADGSKLYVSVGSASNIAEKGLDLEKNRAAILEVDPKTKGFRIYAAGIRNPVGMAWEPDTKMLWAVANERDELGSDLVPDYLTSVQFGGFYGWPWYYWGGYVDKRVPEPEDDMRQYTIRPDYALGPHVAALGLAFAEREKLGAKYASGAFVGLHGSWNRKPVSGYKVIFVPFSKGRPVGQPIDILTGFLDADEQAQGRPVGVALDATGALLVADDVGNRIWRVSAAR